jgi:hypothetical protein
LCRRRRAAARGFWRSGDLTGTGDPVAPPHRHAMPRTPAVASTRRGAVTACSISRHGASAPPGEPRGPQAVTPSGEPMQLLPAREQMAILALFATCVAVLPGLNHSATTLAVWFVGCQSLLSYATAGVAKVVSPTWRGGLALPLIMGSEAHGQPWASAILEAHPSLAVLSTRLVVLFECSFPLVVIAPKGVMIGILAAGVALHLGIAVAMGLNAFLLVFPASYGCVAYIAQQVSPFW